MAKSKATRKKPRRAAARAAARPPEDSSAARCKLLLIARNLFAKYGLDGVSVREIASAAKTNIAQISYYFGGKEGLYREVLESHARNVSVDMSAAIRRHEGGEVTRESFREGIRTIVRQLVEMRAASPEIAVLMQWERISGLPHCRHVYEEIMAPLGDQMVGLVVEAQKKGVVRRDINARSYCIALLEAILGYFVLHDCKISLWKDAYVMPRQKEEFIDFLTRLYTEGAYA